MKIIMIVGLPGSGKTHLAKKLASSGSFLLLDDISSIDGLWSALANGESCIVTDPNLCDSSVRAKAESLVNAKFPEIVLDWIFFENDLAKCRKNVVYRNDGRNVEGTICRFEKVYSIPEGAKVLAIWTVDGTNH